MGLEEAYSVKSNQLKAALEERDELRAMCDELASDLKTISETPPHAGHLAVVMNKTAKRAYAKYEQFQKMSQNEDNPVTK